MGLLVVALVGCEVKKEGDSGSSGTGGAVRKAVAISGAVIIEQDGVKVTYRRKCEWCGHVDGSTHTMDIPRTGTRSTMSFTCRKCKKKSKRIMEGM